MNEVATLISSIGFPCVAAIAMFVGCRYLLDNQSKQTDRMFEMYEKANSENREAIKESRDAIKEMSEAVNRLCEKLDSLKE